MALFVVGSAEEAEVVSHDEVPFFELVEHFDLLDLQAFCLVNAVVVTKISGADTSVAS